MEAEYHNPNPTNTPKTHRYRGVSYTTPINAAKEAVPVVDLADWLCGPGRMRRVGEKWVARCPLPDHEDKTPSFAVYANNSWWCFGCLRGSDVVELYRLYHGYSQREAHTAAAMLLMEFGHEVPERPTSWSAKQKRQRQMRDLIHEAKVEVLSRRLWRYVLEPIVAEIEDPDDRVEATEQLWGPLRMYAESRVREMRGRKA
jgi:hypothetical protein